ncbi:MAG: TonB-dependent receptor [Flavobacteriaceae bacterium]|nr:TonB-dependent receptor [Flavobacteriaceae bacterium]
MKIIFNFLFIGIFVLFLPFRLLAQKTLSGTVVDQNQKPLFNVEIYTPDIHKGTTTNESGLFTLQNLPTGKVSLIFSSLGFETQLVTVNLNEKNTVSIQLKPMVFEIEEVILSTPFNKLQSDNVTKVDFRNMKSLQQSGGSTLMQQLTSIPGISQITTGNSIGKPVIRGLSGNRVLVYANGVRLENQQFGDEHGLGLNDAGIESVEVIKGPASLLYGSDALGGVLYFTPEKFAASGTYKSDYSQKYFSNTEGTNSSLGYKTSTENRQFLIRGSYNSHLDYKIPSGDRIHNTRFNETDFKTGLGFSNEYFSSNLRYNYTASTLGIPEDYGIQSNNRKPEFPNQKIEQHIVSTHNHYYLNNGKIDADFGYIENIRKEFEEAGAAALVMKLKTFNYNLKYYLPKIHQLESIIGVQGMAQTNRNYGEELLIPNAGLNDFGLFTTLNYTLKNTSFQAGIRFDNRSITTEEHGYLLDKGYMAAIDKSFNSFNTSVGLKTNFYRNSILRLNFATGFRAPNLAELTSNGVHEGSNRYEIGNSLLKNEQNFQTDVSFEYKTDHFEFYTNGFYNQINNYIFLTPTQTIIDENDVYTYIQDDSKLYGGEIGVHFHPHPLDWLHLESSFESVKGSQKNGGYLPLIPANKWNNTLKFTFQSNGWSQNSFAAFNVEHTLKQTHISEFETPSASYTLLNLSSGSTFSFSKIKFDASFNIQNAFNKTYISHLSRLKTDFVPAMGRNYVMGIKFNL